VPDTPTRLEAGRTVVAAKDATGTTWQELPYKVW